MDEYVDVFSEKYTKMWKTISWVKFLIKIFINVILIIGLVAICQGLAPYIKGTAVWKEMPFTLSQLEALFCLIVIVWLTMRAMKVYSRM